MALALLALIFFLKAFTCLGADGAPAESAKPPIVIPEALRQQIRGSTDRALRWIASRQQSDGSFPTAETGQPAVTSLCVLAFLANGYLPGDGPYGDSLNRAIDYVIAKQQGNGLICAQKIAAYVATNNSAHTAHYNHAISGLMLAEVYGMVDPKRSAKIHEVLEKAIDYALRIQLKPKRHAVDKGGWRYAQMWTQSDSDLTVTSWHLIFLRSARNAGFDIPAERIDMAMEFVKRCYDARAETFVYCLMPGERVQTRAMAGAGIVALSMGGLHDTDMARKAGHWLLRQRFDQYGNISSQGQDRYHYSLLYASMAMFQLGGDYWNQFFPRAMATLLANQSPEGSWRAEAYTDSIFGNVYTTALCVLAMNTPNQLLPIFQR